MKTKNYFFVALVFITGLVSGISIISMMAFTHGPGAIAPGNPITPVTSADARVFVTSYLASAVPFNQVIKGFTIDKSQLDAMNAISRENAALTGFRVYLGKDNSAKTVGIVVGIDDTGKDAIKNTIFSTESRSLSPCPPICDVSSPIILDK